jgi:thiol-disulfide isomerase/thioredoxin
MTILKFGTSHCPQCKMQERELLKLDDNIAREFIDAEEQENLTEAFKVGTVPTTIVLNDSSEEILRYTGFTKAERIQEDINNLTN